MVSYPLDDDENLAWLAGTDGYFWSKNGVALIGLGTAARWSVLLDEPADRTLLADVMGGLRELASRAGSVQPDPVVFGALPFHPDRGAELVLPKVTIRRTQDGTRLAVACYAGDRPSAEQVRRLIRRSGTPVGFPAAYQIGSATTNAHSDWRSQVETTTRLLSAGLLNKVVLARRVPISASDLIPRARVLERLVAAFGSCMVFGYGEFVGASPELIISKAGRTVMSRPLAGTVEQPAGKVANGAPRRDPTLTSDKHLREHGWVVRAIEADLGPYCETLRLPPRPEPLRVGSLVHLATQIEGTLREPVPTSVELCRMLMPTPAVGGTPRRVALDYIASVEQFDRGYYGGAVGWMDSDGDGEWAISIRCGRITGSQAELYAGVGLVEGSDPDGELLETQVKLKPMIDAIVMPLRQPAPHADAGRIHVAGTSSPMRRRLGSSRPSVRIRLM